MLSVSNVPPDSRRICSFAFIADVDGVTLHPHGLESIRLCGWPFVIAAIMGQSVAQHMEDFACLWHWVAAIRGKGPAPKKIKSIAVTTLDQIFMPVYLDCLFLSCLVCDLNHKLKRFQFKTSIAVDPARSSVIT